MRSRFFPVLFSAIFILPQPVQAQVAPQASETELVTPQKPGIEESPTVITADTVEAKENQILEASGDAELRKDDQLIKADHILFLQQSNELFADGSVLVKKSDTEMTGPSLKMNVKTSIGEMDQPTFALSESTLRGSADTMRIEGKQNYTLEHASYTSCPIGNDDWLLKMSTLELDRNTQTGTAYNARIEFMSVPILYTPWMNFPLDSRRRSGLLGPVLGSTNTGGNEISVPFYWNIASNYDATITPRYIAKRGTLLDNEFRYMGNSYTGKIDYGDIQKDKIALRDRSHASLLHAQNFGGGFSGSLNLNQASDDAYFRDLSPIPAIATQKHLLNEGVVAYSGGWWSTSARMQSYQTLQDPDALIPLPYKRLPQVNLGAQRVLGRAVFALNSEYVDFNHPTLVNGNRTVFYPSIALPLLNDPAIYLTPKVGMHSTQYSMGANREALGYKPYYDRTIPIVSVDAGVTMERDFTAYENEYVQTLEPRIYYVNIPYEKQDMLPNFDSAPAVFSFMQMFTENRFIGNDRIGDADQVTTALTSRLLDANTGNELLRVAVGERFSQGTPRVTLGEPTSTTNQSDILFSVAGRMSNSVSLDSLWQFNPNKDRTEMFTATARYRPEAGKVFNLGYRYTFNADPDRTKTLKQIDLSTQWLLGGRWHMVGQVQYSVQEDRPVQTLGGLEYNQDCWALRFVAQRFATALNVTSTTYFLQLELNDLVRVGTDPLGALKQSVPGYTVLTEQPRPKPAPSVP